MKPSSSLAAVFVCLLTCLAPSVGAQSSSLIPLRAPVAKSTATSLRPASDFNAIADLNVRSVLLFNEALKVISHPRCMNCHPAGDRPTQGDAMRLHQPFVTRGGNGLGALEMNCSTCHMPINSQAAQVPGHLRWQLAPRVMGWQGRSAHDICEQIKNRSLNGNRGAEELIDHTSQDTLVGWAWHPDPGRGPAPGTQQLFGELIKAWLQTGAACPT